ncbi:MAG: hypothetical protein VXZ96_00740 [Myxococcota bacterium]|nr:hypothetical protein [Myxococcota bacterium]
MMFWSVFACSPQFLNPTIESINPTQVVVGSVVPITVTGTQFHVNPHIRNHNEIEIEVDWSIELEHENGQSINVNNLNWVSPEQIKFDAPQELEPGKYQLTLESDDGRKAIADDLLTVSPTALADVKWISFENQYQTEEWALAQVQAVDIDGLPHAEAAYVQIEASQPLNFRDLLESQVTTSNSVSGYLSQSGLGLVAFTSTVPTPVELSLKLLPEGGSGDTIGISFVTGSASQATVSIGTISTVTAGTNLPVYIQLIDENGNPTAGEQRFLRVIDECSGNTEFVDALDSAFVELTPTVSCDESRIRVLNAQDGLILGESNVFSVTPAAPFGLTIQNIQNRVQTGQDFEFIVQLMDEYENVVDETEDQIDLDNLPDEVISLDCTSFSEGLSLCEAQFNQILEGYRLLVQTESGISGFSPFVSVEPGEASHIDIQVDPIEPIAGEDFDLYMRIYDAFDNLLVDVSPNALSIKLGQTPLNCNSISPIGSEQLRLRCQIEEAGVSNLTVQYFNIVHPFDVRIEPSDIVSLVPITPPSQTVAGTTLNLSAELRDSYGNVVTNANPSNIEIEIEGEFESTQIGSAGIANWTWTPTAVGTYQPNVIYQGQSIGNFPEINVDPSSATGLAIELEKTWAIVQGTFEFEVFFVDSYGNRTNETDNIIISRESDGAIIYQGGLTNQLVYNYAPLQAWPSEQLAISSMRYSTVTSVPYDVLANCEFDTALDVDLPNQADNIICMDENPIALEVITEGSHIHYTLGDTWTRTNLSTLNLDIPEGSQTLQVLTRNEALCFNTLEFDLLGAPDRILPYGPIEIALSSSTLDPITQPSADVHLTANRCDGSPAAFQSLMIRSTGGLLESGNTPLSASGSGLNLVLDSLGEADLLLDSVGVSSLGQAEVIVSTASQTAGGSAVVQFQNYQGTPHIVDFEWIEENGVLVETVVYFSVLMDTDEAYLDNLPIILTGAVDYIPSSMAWLDSQTLQIRWPTVDNAQAPLILQMEPFLYSSTGVPFDGVPQSPGTNFEVSSEYVGTESELISCAVSETAFRPDGDDQSGIEADRLSISAQVVGAVSLVRWEITGDSTHFFKVFESTAPNHTEEFNGRDEWGIILPNGQYTVELQPIHEDFSVGNGCTLSFDIDNQIQDIYAQ